ncbi:MAG: formylglycine-generating enzyme family protein, partial [Verrucomicrobia bacterium]|nr:formylglycine-generating enzyme family protein [Verrucomicrobiota bacterium]
GTLLQSSDAVNWTEVASASSPYSITLKDKKLFFCAKGETFEDMTIPLSDTVDLDIIWIEPGTFIMGSPEDELGRQSNETQHQVTLSKGYWLGKYEVTQAQYEAVMGTNPSSEVFIGADMPVNEVEWDDAKEFCQKLTEMVKAAGKLPEGYEYALPTEAQWEYACRAGTTTAFNNGTNISSEEQLWWGQPCPNLDEVGWYGGDSDYTLHPVGQKKPNAWGLYDMHGNVFEWCSDWFGDYPTSAVTDPVGADTGSDRVYRGGGWGDTAGYCRSANRRYDMPSNFFYHSRGFRVALAPVWSKNRTITLPGDVELDMIWIEPGTFLMGSPEDELGRKSNEVQHQVTLTQGYWLGKFEVTQAQYEAVTGKNPSEFKGADLPVEKVNWNDAVKFCEWLTIQERAAGRLPGGYEYTLPTESQWEYACRAGTTTALNSGKDLSDWKECPEVDEVGWYWYNSDKMTHPVGQKQPNAWGLYDMHGNVYEWCLDWFGDYPTSSVTDPTGPSTGSSRVVRGGSWWYDAYNCRSAYRYYGNPSYDYYYYYGFRVALAPVPVESKDMTIPLSGTVNLDMIWIEPGKFTMGSPKDELGRDSNETQHEVTLTQGYWLGKYEVTQAQYEAVTGSNPSEFIGADLPVEDVSWYEARAFCVKLTEIERAAGRLPEGYEYTLPTEAQWEYVCRAGMATALNSGKNLSDKNECPEMDEVGWYRYNSGDKTHPVGQKKMNAWGLYDMHGNVEEWCQDWAKDYPAGDATDPTGPETGTYRIVRGGGWNEDARYCRSASRDISEPDSFWPGTGFRVALAPVPESRNMTIPISEDVDLDMIWINPGTFIMGSPEDELGRDSEETQHKVTLTQGYWLGKFEVTQAQYEAIMGENPSYISGADLPVEYVAWEDAMEFCAKLTEIEKAAGRLPKGYEYTLPTEAQWEYACRAGTTTALNSGKNLSSEEKCPEVDEVAWYAYNTANKTHPVGQKLPNAWGLYDMHGNVLEWCLDLYNSRGYPSSEVIDPIGTTGIMRVVRGGSYARSDAGRCRSAYRLSGTIGFRDSGFRVALAPVK